MRTNMKTEEQVIETYGKQHEKIGNDFISKKISYPEYIFRINTCAIDANKRMLKALKYIKPT